MKDSRTELARMLRQLDEEPMEFSWSEDDLWEDINGRKTTSRPARWYAVAASVGLLLLAGLFWMTHNQESYSMSYEVAYEEVDGFQDPTSELVLSAQALIAHSCDNQSAVCESSEFKSLSQELAMLQQQINSLDEMIKKYGNDPVFIKSRIQIENLKSEITNKLIQMVMS